jgi:hypothetical protein
VGQENFGDLSCANRTGREVALGALGAYHQPVRAYRILGDTKRAIHRHFVNFDADFGGFDLFAEVAACCRKMQINIDGEFCARLCSVLHSRASSLCIGFDGSNLGIGSCQMCLSKCRSSLPYDMYVGPGFSLCIALKAYSHPATRGCCKRAQMILVAAGSSTSAASADPAHSVNRFPSASSRVTRSSSAFPQTMFAKRLAAR